MSGRRTASQSAARKWLHRTAGSGRVILSISVLCACVLVLQTARAVQTLKREHELSETLERWETLSGRLESQGPGESLRDDLSRIPAMTDPAELLIELSALLERAGVEEYRFALVDPERYAAGLDGDEDSYASGPGEDHASGPWEDRPLLTRGTDDREQSEAGPEELEWADPSGLPDEIEEWRLALELRSSYAQLLEVLLAAEDDSRLWSAPRARLSPQGDKVAAEILLRTFSRKAGQGAVDRPSPDPGQGAAVNSGSKSAGAWDHTQRDPFHAERVSRPASVRAEPPRLGAIRWGGDPSVWIQGSAVRPGETLGGWTLLQVLPEAAIMRHADGTVVRISAGS